MKLLRNLFMSAAVGGMILACNNDVMDPQGKIGGGAEEGECGCIPSYGSVNGTIDGYGQGILVDVTSDGTTLSLRLYREDDGNNGTQIGNVFVGGEEEARGGGNLNEYTIETDISTLALCELLVIPVKIVGAGGAPVTFEFDYRNRPICNTEPPMEEVCTEETAFGGATKGATTSKNKAWWFAYTAGSGEQNIIAGQNMAAGTVTISGGTYTITLAEGWRLKAGETESVKIQGYNTLPSSRPAAGKFTTYKGTNLTGPIGTFNFYVIHLDVERCEMVPVN